MFQRLARFLEVREATEDELSNAFPLNSETASADGTIVRDYDESIIGQQVKVETIVPAGSNLDLAAEFLAHAADTHQQVQPFATNEDAGIGTRTHRISAEEDEFIQSPNSRLIERNRSVSLDVVSGVTPESQTRQETIIQNQFTGSRTKQLPHETEDDQLSEVSLESSASSADKQQDYRQEFDVNIPIISNKSEVYRQNYGNPQKQDVSGDSPVCFVLDKELANILMQPNAHLTGQFDEALLNWIETASASPKTETASASPKTSMSSQTFENNSQSGVSVRNGPVVSSLEDHVKILESQLREFEQMKMELQCKTERMFFLETELVASERIRLEMEERYKADRTSQQARIEELESKLQGLSTEALMTNTRILAADVLMQREKNVTEKDSQTKLDDLMKHCARLVKRLGHNEDSSAKEDVELAKLAGKQLAAMSARVAISEQHMKDEKLVLKNLFLSWMERGERKDAFEILARAFDFTPEDRQRMEAKNVLARGKALGVNWSLSEGIADFIRDETT